MLKNTTWKFKKKNFYSVFSKENQMDTYKLAVGSISTPLENLMQPVRHTLHHITDYSNLDQCQGALVTLIKKKNKFSSYLGKFRVEQLQSHIWLTASSSLTKYLLISSYIRKPFLTLQQLHSEFPYIEWKFYFIFYQCTVR